MAQQGSQSRGGSLSRHAILLAEDEAVVRDFIVLALQREGYVVLPAENGEQALEASRRHEGAIDLLITDIVMPKMNGIELSDRIMKERPRIRVLAISGKSLGEVLAQDSGFAFLRKPFLPRELTEKVRELLGKPPGGSAGD